MTREERAAYLADMTDGGLRLLLWTHRLPLDVPPEGSVGAFNVRCHGGETITYLYRGAPRERICEGDHLVEREMADADRLSAIRSILAVEFPG